MGEWQKSGKSHCRRGYEYHKRHKYGRVKSEAALGVGRLRQERHKATKANDENWRRVGSMQGTVGNCRRIDDQT